MKKSTVLAAIVTPVVAAGAGFMIARANNADASNASGYCAEPSVYVDMAEGVSMITGGTNANCAGDSCTVAGLEQVEVNAGGQVQCVDVSDGQTLLLTRRGEAVTVTLENAVAP